MNPYSDFLQPQKGGRILTEQEAKIAKIGAFCRDVYKVKAVTANGREITLGKRGAKIENVDFVAGLWRVQKKFPYKITHVRDKDMVLMERIQHTESTKFNYWRAKLVGYNCYGPFIIKGSYCDYIVSQCITDKGVHWGYGTTLEAARAFLGLKVWDEYKDVIRDAVFNDKTK